MLIMPNENYKQHILACYSGNTMSCCSCYMATVLKLEMEKNGEWEMSRYGIPLLLNTHYF